MAKRTNVQAMGMPQTLRRKRGRVFPTFAAILLVVGIIWLLSDLGVITVSIPWIPIVLVIVALGIIVNKHHY